MSTPLPLPLEGQPPATTGPNAAERTGHPAAVGEPKGAARQGVLSSLRPDPHPESEPEPGPFRVLVTGSRDWPHPEQVHRELSAARQTATGPLVVVHGACPTGADRAAADWTAHMRRVGQLSVTAEAHPADWQRHGKAAGPRRNTAMVRAGADLCLAFIHNASPGATHAARTAEAAGIPTLRYTTTATAPHPGDPTPERPGIRIYAPPLYRDHDDGARWSTRTADTPTAAYACPCGQTCTAIGHGSVSVLVAAYDAHKAACPGVPAPLTEGRTAA
ncbi:SLOG family protein [Streptomyces sp. NPDC058335]|uniref:SLOG family protein n=1 Tax=Streptomyces sp. NPDC058335 TaxID=3346451 RepID=UPI003651B226